MPNTNTPSIFKIVLIGILSLAAILVIALIILFPIIHIQDVIKSVKLEDQQNQKIQDISNPNNIKFNQDIAQVRNLWSTGKYDDMLTATQTALSVAQTDQQKGTAHFWMGVAYYKLSKDKEAEAEELLAIQLDPKESAGPYNTLAAIALNSDPQKALDYAQKSIDADPTYAWAHNAKGMALVDLGKKQEGIDEINKAIQLDPTNEQFRLNLTRVKEN